MTQPTKRLGFFSRLLDQTTAAERYRLAAEQIVHAERHGFDSAWVAQHHFHEQEGGLPSPFPFLAYVAARTSRIRLGTGVITLPMEDAVRVAEDAIVTDLLSDGRLEVGLGAGSTPASFEAFGLSAEQRHEAYQARHKILLDAWAGEPLGHDENRLYPAAPHLIERVWLASFSVYGGVQAGRAGDGLMLSRTQPRPAEQPQLRLDEIQNPIIDAYLEALPAGRAPRIMASRSLFVADDRAEALRLAEIGLARVAHRFAKQGHRIGSGSLRDVIKALDVHVGTPDDVIETLRADSVLARATDLVFQVHSVDPPHPHILRSIELTAAHVAPALGWVNRHTPAKPLLASVG
ncbi:MULTISPECIES: putative FMN-dependent luciferase-like monooxygenase [Bradyrhizobium]|jgi:putative FMN-dependent luciferase-like monooxygenase|uniref:putative FMN-dependent luciferase-like monooxygenase n=1 Tax=Bradyrhizobium TaxID=374 RepID=UPI0003A578EA|nr:putative FMN-dependent luciferase-like monooxygenase [Bradyrhizobium denitrificans]MCL8487010.1 putative FMN-dependent luciferase-like monooxygenase [Bradyrhizobium denitrificans]RTL94711.1 MAG: putative FMN-dependent luciferase-like monooxygenase [Bradyrhizobiaceae bacterium]